MQVCPLRDFVLVTKDEPVKQTSSGLYVPSMFEHSTTTGVVVAVGSGKLLLDGTVAPLEVTMGDKVMFNKAYATEVTVEEKTYLLLREEQIFCTLKQ